MGHDFLPTELKEIKGTRQNCRTNFKEPKTKLEFRQPPSRLKPSAKIAWTELNNTALEMKVPVGAEILETAANVYADIRDLRERQKDLNMENKVYFTIMTQIRAAEKIFLVCLAKLGMTPADKQRVQAEIDDRIEKNERLSNYS